MVANVHIHLKVGDLSKSREFYRKFFDSEPVKERADYAKFLPAFAPINLALSPGQAGIGDTHFGIQLGDRDSVRKHLERVKAAGLAVREELGTDCCYANQDKFWVGDPDGNAWEVYVVNRDVETPPAKESTGCCQPGQKCGL